MFGKQDLKIEELLDFYWELESAELSQHEAMLRAMTAEDKISIKVMQDAWKSSTPFIVLMCEPRLSHERRVLLYNLLSQFFDEPEGMDAYGQTFVHECVRRGYVGFLSAIADQPNAPMRELWMAVRACSQSGLYAIELAASRSLEALEEMLPFYLKREKTQAQDGSFVMQDSFLDGDDSPAIKAALNKLESHSVMSKASIDEAKYIQLCERLRRVLEYSEFDVKRFYDIRLSSTKKTAVAQHSLPPSPLRRHLTATVGSALCHATEKAEIANQIHALGKGIISVAQLGDLAQKISNIFSSWVDATQEQQAFLETKAALLISGISAVQNTAILFAAAGGISMGKERVALQQSLRNPKFLESASTLDS